MEPLACSNQPITCSDLTDKFDTWKNNPIQIHHIDPEDDWELGAQVEDIANKTGIRFNRSKDTRIVATDQDGNVVGGVADEFSPDEDDKGRDHYIYDFDTVVHPKHQKSASLVGPQLIHAAVKKAKKESLWGLPVSKIRTWCVNNRLAQIMVDHFGFEPEDERAVTSDGIRGPVHLVKYL